MRGWLVLAVLAGCGFEVGGTSSDAPRAIDAAPVVDASPDAPGPPITLVQKGTDHPGSGSMLEVTMPAPQIAGNTNIVVVSWFAAAGEVQSVSDTSGNTYASTNIPIAGSFSIRMFYAANIIGSANGNHIVAQLASSVSYPKLRVFEYAGLGPSPFEGGTSSNGNGSSVSSGPVTTTTPHVLLFAADVIDGSSGAIAPFVARDITDGDLVETHEVQVAGTYTATATIGFPNRWVMMMAAFRGT